MDKYLGKRLDGRYEMRELIGVGGMAYVYKAYDSIDDRTVAVKILRDEYLSNDEFVRRFRNESKAIAILNHPNIVKVLDVGFGERLQYIVMEYIDGITLKEYLDQRKDIRWKEAVHFTVQILRALQHAHDKGIVHRDIKPQNIMLLSDGTIKVTDFGIARLTRSEMQATAVGNKAIGSVHYISPEQARGEITDEKTDLYSVGIMLYEMLTGKLPFEADNAVSVAIMQMQSEATLPHLINEEIPEGLEQITLKAMQKDTVKRYQSAAEMLSDIDEFKRNPSIKFEYTYFEDETPTRYVDAITRIRGGESDEKPAKAEDKKKKSKTNKGRISLIAILSVVAVGVVVGIIILIPWLLEQINGNKRVDEIVVDNFIGMHYNDEVLVHENIGNYEVKYETGYEPEYPEGYVYKQDPLPNSKQKIHKPLTLYISLGDRKVKIPAVNPGESADLVRGRLKDAGFVVEELTESSTEVAEGKVTRISPEPGEEAAYGSVITMYVSTGEPKAEPITMSNVIGIELADAIDMLVRDGFTRSNIKTEVVNNKAKKDTVIRSSHNSEEKHLPDSVITLTVSSGFQDVTIKLALPDTSMPIDLQFYVGGKKDADLSDDYIGIKPNEFTEDGTITFTVKETQAKYKVSVAIAKAGTNIYYDYALFEVDGVKGTHKKPTMYEFPEITTGSTTSTTEPTVPPTDPVDPGIDGGATDPLVDTDPTAAVDPNNTIVE